MQCSWQAPRSPARPPPVWPPAYVVLGANKAVSAATLSSYLTHAQQLYTLATTHQGSYQTLTDDPCLAQLGVRVNIIHDRGFQGKSMLSKS